MRYIKKSRPPPEFTAEMKKSGATYDGLHCKAAVRTALGQEQGWLCCYCMRRLTDSWNTVKVEHRKSQDEFPRLQLDWKNMLAACRGGEGNPPRDQHCDTRKARRSITLDPTNSIIDEQIHYLVDGTVKAEAAAHDAELNDVLGLNQEFLRRNRREKLRGFIDAMSRGDSRTWSIEKLQAIIDEANTPVDNKLQEYAGVIVWWVRKRIAKRR